MEEERLKTLMDRVEKLERERKYERAIPVLEEALAIAPKNVEVLRQYGKFLAKTKRYEDALKIFKQALEIEPYNVDALRNYGTYLDDRGRYWEAIATFRKALEINPNDVKLLSSYNKALRLAGELDESFIISEKLLKIEPKNAINFTIYANALTSAGRYRKAFKMFERSLQVEPNNVIALNSYANAMISTEEYGKAFKMFERSLRIQPNNVITINCYANALILGKHYRKAFRLFERSLKVEPNNAITLMRYGRVLSKKDDSFERAIALQKKAVSLEPENTWILRSYGASLVSLRKFEESCTVFRQLLQIESDNYISLKYANSLEELGNYQEAISQLEAANLDEVSQSLANVIRISLGRLYYRIKKPDKGNEYFEEAIANSDDKNKTRLSSARNILASDPYNETAIEILRKIAEDSSLYPQAQKMLTLNLTEEEYFKLEMDKGNAESGLKDTEMLNRAMYHKIANEISILKGIAYRILHLTENESSSLYDIIQDIENIFVEIERRRTEQRSEIEMILQDDYSSILTVISKTAHDISDFVNNELAIIKSKTLRVMDKLQPHESHYSQFEKLLAQLELTQTALNDLKAINEGINIKSNHFQVKKLFEKWEATPQIDRAKIVLDIQNGNSRFNGDEEKIKSILNELVENSLKHNNQQPYLIIRIKSQDTINPAGIRGMTIPGEQKYLLIEFSDNGKGVLENKKDWIFQPLKTTSEQGSGLGLFIIRKTLAKMKGCIRETGRNGAKFEVYIPYTEGDN